MYGWIAVNKKIWETQAEDLSASNIYYEIPLYPDGVVQRVDQQRKVDGAGNSTFLEYPGIYLTAFVVEDYVQGRFIGAHPAKLDQTSKPIPQEAVSIAQSTVTAYLPESVVQLTQSMLSLGQSAQKTAKKLAGIAENIEEHTHIVQGAASLVSSAVSLGLQGINQAKDYVYGSDDLTSQ